MIKIKLEKTRLKKQVCIIKMPNEEKFLSVNINQMNRSQLYQRAIHLAIELGEDQGQLRALYRTYKKKKWKTKIKQLERKIKFRDRNYNKVLKLSRDIREPLRIPNILSGSNRATWVRELNRLKMRARRKPLRIQEIRLQRNRAAPVLGQIRRNGVLMRERLERKELRPKDREPPPLRPRVERKIAIGKIMEEKKTIAQLNAEKEAEDRRNLIVDLINDGKFQRIFNDIKNDQKNVLTTGQAETLLRKISNGKIKAKLQIDGVIQYLPFNNKTRKFFMRLLTTGYIIEEGETFGSDTIDNLKINIIEELEIIKMNEPQRLIPNKDGRFFPYINTTDLDLSRYQIYNQEQAIIYANNRSHCLIHSLRLLGISEAVLNQIKLSITTDKVNVANCSFVKKDLTKAAKIINKCIVLHTIRSDGKIRKQQYNKTNKECVHLALHDNHYFVFEKTIYSRFFIKKYDKINNHEVCNNNHRIKYKNKYDIVRINKGYPEYSDKPNSKINSLLMVVKLHEAKKFKQLDMSMFPESSSHPELKDHIYLGNIINEQAQCCNPGDEYKEKKHEIFFADCESFVHDEVKYHELYLLGCVGQKNDFVEIYNKCGNRFQHKEKSPEQMMVYQWLRYMTNNGKQDVIVYFHNLKYDYHLLEKYLNIRSICKKDGILYSVNVSYKNKDIELRDSYKLISFGLNKFTETFDLDKKYSKKEAIYYKYYTKENDNKIIETKYYINGLTKKEKKIFYKNMKEEYTYNSYKKTFNPTSYYMDYLELDCLVLKKGMEKFDDLIKEITGGKMSVYDELTISSLTDNYMVKEDCYSGVFAVTGNLREYITRACKGGRVAVNKKYKKRIIEVKISDYDANSLYPSAINRLTREIGVPCGKAVRYETHELKNWESKLYSILTVQIIKLNKEQQIPFISYKNKDGLLEYTNTPPEEPIIVDSITLQDYIKFHEIEYRIIDGVYWDNGSNKKLGEIVRKLFKARLKAKKDKKKALSNVIKLMLNSIYGKTLISKSDSKIKIMKLNRFQQNKETKEWIKIDETNQFDNYVYNNFNSIKSWRPMMNENLVEIEEQKTDIGGNRAHIGCAVLSMSKRIMNEVFDIANENNYPFYYTDTDSLHCNLDDVLKLENKYREKYDRELNGKGLEQFHTDFDLEGAADEIYAVKSIFLGKKSYLDVLESKDKNGDIIHGYHIRLKGVTKEGLEDAAKKYKNSYEGLYTDLANNKEIEIILNPFNKEEEKQKVMFEYANGKVRTRQEFTRKIKF